VRGFYAEGFVQQVWRSAGEVTEKLKALPLVQAGFLQATMIVPLKPYLGFAPRPD